MDLVLIGLWAFATLWAAILVHEAGHYAAGLVVGVPARAMRIRLERPPHVALRDGDAWRSPSDAEYHEVFRRHARSTPAAWLFVAGGFVVETLAVLGLAYLLRDGGYGSLVVLCASTALFLLYVVGDAVQTARSGQPYGDAGALWAVQPVVALVFLTTVLALRGAAMIVV